VFVFLLADAAVDEGMAELGGIYGDGGQLRCGEMGEGSWVLLLCSPWS